MATRQKEDSVPPRRRPRPATTPEGRENQLIALATDLVERRMREGTATAAEVVHFLKLGSTREQLEQERMRREVELMSAKTENLANAGRMEELVNEALNAMRSYKGLAEEVRRPRHED